MSEPTVLLTDDDAAIRTVVSRALAREGYRVQATGTASALWRWIEAGEGDVAVIDVVLPDDNGLDLLPRMRRRRPDLPIVVMSAQNTLLTAVRAAERGAFEYLPKPFDLNELVTTVRRALAAPGARPTAAEAEALLRGGGDGGIDGRLPIIGRSPAMQDVYRVIARLTGTDLTVMISGESGTGKELVARALHDYGKRRHGPFVAVNMAAIPRELIESELFGHEKGAFTGAAARKAGRFEQAEGGTLFLDEIGDMPLDAQTRLLRVLQSGEFMAVGGRQPIRANLRIVAATHRDLRHLVAQGLFREDLFYRLNVVPVRLPALRERREDIPALVQHFLARVHADEGLPLKAVSGEGMELLRSHDWPGNVRELENLIRRLAVLYTQEALGPEVIEAELREGRPATAAAGPHGGGGGEGGDGDDGRDLAAMVEDYVRRHVAAKRPAAGLYGLVLREVERPLIGGALAVTRGNQLKAAHLLGLNRNTLRKKIRELDIEVVRGPR